MSSQTQSEIWTQMAVQAQGGDKRCYAELLRAIMPFIKMRLAGNLANPDWVDDITQEVLISVHKSLHTYRPDKPFTAWLKAIINFRRTDYLRQHYRVRKQKEHIGETYNFLGASVTNPTHAGEYKDVESALGKLPKKQRKIIELLKIRGYSVKEVANQMHMSETAVKVASHRALKKLEGDLS